MHPFRISENTALQKFMLVCGILSSVWYVLINVYVPLQYEGYSVASLTVSELSAIGAPTRRLWVVLVAIYPILFFAFGLGVLRTSDGNRPLNVVGWLIVFYAVFNFYWPPMHMRGVEPTLTDTLHIVWAFVTVLLMILMMGFGAVALGNGFRIYTITSIVLHILFGILTGIESPNIPLNGPTPTIGIWERINIAVFMIWVIILALELLKKFPKKHSY